MVLVPVRTVNSDPVVTVCGRFPILFRKVVILVSTSLNEWVTKKACKSGLFAEKYKELGIQKMVIYEIAQ